MPSKIITQIVQLLPVKNDRISPFPASILSRAGSAGLALAAGLLLAAGCSTTQPPDPMAEAAEAGERPVAMKGDRAYFDGKLFATVTVSRGFSRNLDGPARGKNADRDRRSRQEDASTAGLSNSYPTGFEGASESDQREMYEDMVRLARAHRAKGSPMPPVTLRLKLENRGPDPIEVDLLEVNSDLGNFAVRPTKLTLAAAQTGEADPMVSQLGVTSDEIPVKVTFRIAGQKESQVVVVKSIITVKEKK
jgi:hypothetical protein